MSRPSLAAVLLAIGAGLAFVASESLRVVTGARGTRRKRIEGSRASRSLFAIGGLGIAVAIAGLVLAPQAVPAAALVAVPAALVAVLAGRRAIHAFAGELIAAIALAGAAVPVAVASSVPEAVALELWAGWSIGYASTVIAVHRVIARHRDRELARGGWLIAGLVTAGIAIAIAAWFVWPLVVAAPLILASAAVVAARLPATRLRAIGIGLSIVSIGSGALVLGL